MTFIEVTLEWHLYCITTSLSVEPTSFGNKCRIIHLKKEHEILFHSCFRKQ
jgi:hypothetical protein